MSDFFTWHIVKIAEGASGKFYYAVFIRNHDISFFAGFISIAVLILVSAITSFSVDGRDAYNSLYPWMCKEPLFSFDIYKRLFDKNKKNVNVTETIMKIALKNICLIFVIIPAIFVLVIVIGFATGSFM